MLRFFPLLLSVILSSLSAFAATDNKIIIGQSVELSGQANGEENMLGAQLYFNLINAQGGMYGRQIELISYDDRRDPLKTKENTLKLINENHVLALFGYRSTPTVEAILPLLEKNKIPLIAPFSGAQSLREPLHPYVFNLRASYQEEAVKMVESLATLQIKKVAILYQDDTFGKDGLAGFEKSLTARQLQPIVIAEYKRKDLNLAAAVASVAAADPQAVLMACNPIACADFIKRMRASGHAPQFLMLSNVNSKEFFTSLGKDGRGIGVMQVTPSPNNVGVTVVREFQYALKTASHPPPATAAVEEGFIAAKLLAEGLRRAGANPNAQKLVAALEAMHDVDLGGVFVNYGARNHDGSHFVELSIVGQNGRLIR